MGQRSELVETLEIWVMVDSYHDHRENPPIQQIKLKNAEWASPIYDFQDEGREVALMRPVRWSKTLLFGLIEINIDAVGSCDGGFKRPEPRAQIAPLRLYEVAPVSLYASWTTHIISFSFRRINRHNDFSNVRYCFIASATRLL